MWIDTHVHFDAAEFDATRADDWTRAQAGGVAAQVVPAVAPSNFTPVIICAEQFPDTFFALGIHPLYVMNSSRDAGMEALRATLVKERDNPRLVAIGEIGLDGFVAGVDWDTQVWFLREQLKLAREFDLPVLLHVRRAVDAVGKHLCELGVSEGIAHAFNGNMVQAQRFIEMGLHLGFGGVLTHPRALNIRRLASELPLSSIVLETDAPDMPPAWVRPPEINHSAHLPRIAGELAALRGLSLDALQQALWGNTLRALPRMACHMTYQMADISPHHPPLP